ncbi:phosphoinositide-3-kinase, regulatory subunit 4 [Globodera pallida]|nr:phosphoinositide-3-kinase, regulatory subunit 4 [Globodera pallida]
MGNVQTSSIANQLLPFESYIIEIPELKYVASLGATRFMKVARVDHVHKGPLVVKVFVIIDQQIVVEPYRDQLLQISRRLIKHPNFSPINRVFVTSRAAILCRPFYKSTLYDRLSTRPYLTSIEKRWIAFQLLKALAQLRIALVRHGDIKPQNVLVSSSLWIQLTDFAPFKPALLPIDNPSDFTFFFDTDRRRHCYLAPERFRDSEELEARASAVAGDFPNFYECLTEAMDIFAMGCLLVELLSDGRQIAFNLPQAIDYKTADEHTAKFFLKRLLSAVPDTEFRPLIAIMLDRDPKRRRDEFLKLSPCSSTVLFPQIFERYLYNYFKELQSIQSADALITKLFVERDNYMALLRDEDAANSQKWMLFRCFIKSAKFQLRSSSLNGIVPYLAHSISDHFPLVRAEAILILCDILSTCANSIPPDECRLLIDFVFPKLCPIVISSACLPRIALATNLGKLAQISARFFEASVARMRSESPEQNQPESGGGGGCSSTTVQQMSSRLEKFLCEEKRLLLETERTSSIDAVTEFFVTFCGCTDNEVRRCLFQPTNLDLLCQFFGASRVTDVLMHMITLLNDKHDWRVRAAFFEACPVLAQHLGQNRNSKLMPFLQQGLQDCEEFVVLECVCCVHALCRRQLLPKATICELLPDLVPLLVHPNKWLRIALVNILTILETDSCFTIADIYCKLTPLVTTFLRQPLIRLDCRDVLYETLVQPISRQIWDFICEQNNSAELITLIEERKTLEKLGGATKGNSGSNNSLLFNVISSVATMHHFDEKLNVADGKLPKGKSTTGGGGTKVDGLLRKLHGMGLSDQDEDKLLAFKGMLSRMDRFRREHAGRRSYRADKASSEKSRIRLHELHGIRRRIFDLDKGVHLSGPTVLNSDTQFYVDRFGAQRLLFSASEYIEPAQVVDLNDHYHPSQAVDDSSSARILLEDTLRHKQKRYADQRRITTNSGDANCELVAERIAAATESLELGSAGTKHNGIGADDRERRTMARARRPNIRMQVHLHEHASKVTRLAVHPDQDHFASSSTDNSVKIWSSTSLLNSSQPASMSLDTLRYSHAINACGFMGDQGGHLVMACADASLQMFDIERKTLLKSVQLDREAEGPVSDLYCVEHLIYALTHHSSVFCYDLRIAPKKGRNAIELSSVWQRRIKNSYGLITSFCIDTINQHWMLLTASSATTKNMLLWDLRFAGLEVCSWSHPSDRIIPLRSWALPNGSRCDRALTNCSREAELSIWDLSTRSRTDVLWPSTEAPLTYKTEMVSTAVAPSMIDGSNIIFTGDSEGSLRCWNLRYPNASAYLCGPYRRHLPSGDLNIGDLQQLKSPSRIVYRQMQIADSVLRVQAEDRSQLISPEAENGTLSDQSHTHRMLQHAPEAHWDSITDLASLWPHLLVSAGREGVIKMWKVC